MPNTDWSHGYVTDTSYTDRFFRELSPVWLNYVAALHGAAPRRIDRPFTYLELGCGFGQSAVVHAGACPRGEFHACDFNPAHIEGASRQAAALGVGNIQFHQTAFEDLPTADLPPFDFIVLHGVYSWIGGAARQAVRRIIHQTLKPGGLLYVSYNALPGWAAEVPLRKMLMELAAAAPPGTTQQRAEQARVALKAFSQQKIRYFTANPATAAAVDAYLDGPSNYLVHEFLNEAWEPFYSIDVADEMAEAGARFVGSATLPDNHQALIAPEAAAGAVAALPTDRLRQLGLDFAVDRRFRRDVFIRDAIREDGRHHSHRFSSAASSSAAASGAAASVAAPTSDLAAVPIGCTGNPASIGMTAQVPRGAIRFQEPFILELRELMSRGSHTMGDAVTALGAAGRNAPEIARNLTLLVAAGTLMPFAQARPAQARVARRPATPAVARVLADARERGTARAIPSEILGNGLPIAPLDALAIAEWQAGATDVASLTMRLHARLNASRHARPEAAEAPARAPDRPGLRAAEDSPQEEDSPQAIARRVIEDVLPALARLGLFV